MGKIAFVTDSTAYLTQQQIEENNITVVPLSVIFGDKAYREGVELSAAQFYSMLSTEKAFPTTSQPPIGEFAKAFEELQKDHDTILCLMLSQKLSGTYSSAYSAAKMVGGDIHVVDSGIASYGIAGPLLDGIQLAKQGASVQDILDLWQKELSATKAYFLVDTLEQLHRGGRIGGAAAVFGALLQIKPILTIDDGQIALYEKVRTHKRALERILSEFDKDASTGQPLQLGIVHAVREADAIKLRDELLSKYSNVHADIAELGPVIGTHSGPGLLALVYYPRLLESR